MSQETHMSEQPALLSLPVSTGIMATLTSFWKCFAHNRRLRKNNRELEKLKFSVFVKDGGILSDQTRCEPGQDPI